MIDAQAFGPLIVLGLFPVKTNTVPAPELTRLIECAEADRIKPDPGALVVDTRTTNCLAVSLPGLRRGLNENNGLRCAFKIRHNERRVRLRGDSPAITIIDC